MTEHLGVSSTWDVLGGYFLQFVDVWKRPHIYMSNLNLGRCQLIVNYYQKLFFFVPSIQLARRGGALRLLLSLKLFKQFLQEQTQTHRLINRFREETKESLYPTSPHHGIWTLMIHTKHIYTSGVWYFLVFITYCSGLFRRFSGDSEHEHLS